MDGTWIDKRSSFHSSKRRLVIRRPSVGNRHARWVNKVSVSKGRCFDSMHASRFLHAVGFAGKPEIVHIVEQHGFGWIWPQCKLLRHLWHVYDTGLEQVFQESCICGLVWWFSFALSCRCLTLCQYCARRSVSSAQQRLSIGAADKLFVRTVSIPLHKCTCTCCVDRA
jgi:hypothetical protein